MGGVVKEAAKVVNSMMLIVMLPIVQGIGITIFLIVWFIYIVFIATAGEKVLVDKDSYGPLKLPYKTFKVTENQESALWFMLFDLFWTMEFVEALGQIIVTTAAATYYFTRDRSTIGNSTVVFAARHATWYHAGTAAFGSFIIAVIKIIKAILMYIQRKCENAIDATGDGPVQRMQKKIARVVFFCFQCCIWCLEKCMKFINKEAYIQTAIFGHPFCTAAQGLLLGSAEFEARGGAGDDRRGHLLHHEAHDRRDLRPRVLHLARPGLHGGDALDRLPDVAGRAPRL